eukprot:TRINITY_DN5646_c0_g2_i1.p1 TRINITY_DN5646_c0_g2~~TRINITY_DN5646_c0_g2_i1.p1  ORF type:complete len:100 (+),score=0.72 TRINITY_DN5646_c0_g2_i1:805-1104(+)
MDGMGPTLPSSPPGALSRAGGGTEGPLWWWKTEHDSKAKQRVEGVHRTPNAPFPTPHPLPFCALIFSPFSPPAPCPSHRRIEKLAETGQLLWVSLSESA